MLPPRLLAVFAVGLALCAVSCDQQTVSKGANAGAAPSSARSSGAPIDDRDAARTAVAGVDALLSGKTPSPATQNFFSVYNNATHAYTRNPDCIAARIDTTCVSVANSANADGTGGNRGCVTLVTPLHGVTNHHFSQPYQVGVVHYFVDLANNVYPRTVVKAEQVGTVDLEVVTFDSPLPASIHPAQLFPAGSISRLLPAGTPLLATNQQKQAIITELAGATPTDIVVRPALSVERRPWTASPPAVLGDSDSPTFAVLGRRPLLMFTYFTSASGPSLSENIAGIDALIGRRYALDIATID